MSRENAKTTCDNASYHLDVEPICENPCVRFLDFAEIWRFLLGACGYKAKIKFVNEVTRHIWFHLAGIHLALFHHSCDLHWAMYQSPQKHYRNNLVNISYRVTITQIASSCGASIWHCPIIVVTCIGPCTICNESITQVIRWTSQIG